VGVLFAISKAMQNPLAFEIVGYIASVVIAISVMNTNVLRLRLFNLAGAVLFTIYGFLIKAWPVAGLNLFVAGVNCFHLYKIFRNREYFKILEVAPDSTYLKHFIAHHLKDIRKDTPRFDYEPTANQLTLFVLRNTVPAGLFIGEVKKNGDLEVKLDYVTPDYRDLKVGEFLLNQQIDYFREHGVKRIVSPAGSGRHAKYLKEMGFVPAPPTDDTDLLFTRSVA
jgi:GNAT superfamily N-acetyltransferase